MCAASAEKAGIYTGTHVLSNFDTTNDAYVTPRPDKRLAKAGSTKILQAISAADTSIEIADPLFNQHKNDNLHSVVIGNEIIRYSTVTDKAPWKLKDCVRGAFGTTAVAHPKNEIISKAG